jgi:hypothetical protein
VLLIAKSPRELNCTLVPFSSFGFTPGLFGFAFFICSSNSPPRRILAPYAVEGREIK